MSYPTGYPTGSVRRSHPDKIAAAMPAHEHPVVKAALAAHADGSSPLPSSVDLDSFTPRGQGNLRADQGPYGSCTASSSTLCAATAFAAAGNPLPFVPSQRALYAATRAKERAAATPIDPLPALTDSGAELADVVAVLSTVGVKPMAEPLTPDGRFNDIDDATINAEPALGDLEASEDTKIDGPYFVDPTHPDASDVLAACLANKIPIEMAFLCDSAFQALAPGQIAQPPSAADQSAGGHAVFLSGYHTAADGSRIFYLTNSWGDWCESGRCEVGVPWLNAAWEAWPFAVSVASKGS